LAGACEGSTITTASGFSTACWAGVGVSVGAPTGCDDCCEGGEVKTAALPGGRSISGVCDAGEGIAQTPIVLHSLLSCEAGPELYYDE